MAYHYIIINIALATPIPRYAMRPVISNAIFFMADTSFIRVSTISGIFIQILEKTFQIYLTIGNQ
nr:MAG TPA: hypothetical protein [Caudoviricetes sp.]